MRGWRLWTFTPEKHYSTKAAARRAFLMLVKTLRRERR
jgi:hypothetical protein